MTTDFIFLTNKGGKRFGVNIRHISTFYPDRHPHFPEVRTKLWMSNGLHAWAREEIWEVRRLISVSEGNRVL